MNILNKLTKKNLQLNKKRTIVTIIGIMLSVALITAVAAMFFSARASFIRFETREKGNYHYVFEHILESDIKYFKENRNFESLYYTSNIGYARLEESKNEYKPYAFVKAFDEVALENLGINLVSGRLPQNDSEILIPTHLKTNGRVTYKIGDVLELEVGKRMRGEEELDQSNPYVKIEDENKETPEAEGIVDEKIVEPVTKRFTIVGIMERPTSAVEEYSAPGYTFATLMDKDKIDGTVDIYVRYTKEALKNEAQVTADILGVDRDAFQYLNYTSDFDEKKMEEAREKLGEPKYNYGSNHYLIMLESGATKETSMQALATVATFVVVIIIFTSVFCIKNSFNISITEKIKQYGMLSTVGATSKQIKRNVYYEAMRLGMIGIPLGVLCGLLASYILIIISNYLIREGLGFDLIYSFSWLAVLFAVALGLLTLYLSAWSSAHKAAKVSPITAIRNSENIKINPKKVKSPKYIKRMFGVGGDISYKNLKRNKKKYRATVISIIVCVSVFIALSSFITLAFDAVQNEFETTDYNIELSYNIKTDGLKEKAMEVVNFDHVGEYSISAHEYISADNRTLSFNKEYLKYFPDIQSSHVYKDVDGVDREEYSETTIIVYRVGEHAYKKYLDTLGLKYDDVEDKGILYDYSKTWIEDEKTNKMSEKIMPLLDYKKGDILKFKVGTGKYDEVTNESIMKDVNIELSFIADELPFGIHETSSPILILSDSYFESLLAEGLNSDAETIFIDSSNATKLQDDIEEHLKSYDGDYSLINTEESVKMMRSMYLLVAIFLYGFITVIALIGITNIFNTITTNMELRSREFATLKSIGMTRKEFNRMIRLESFFYGTKSLLIGIPIGTLLSIFIYNILSEGYSLIPYKVPLVAIVISTLAVFILITCIMKYSINKINKQNTIETIRNENI